MTRGSTLDSEVVSDTDSRFAYTLSLEKRDRDSIYKSSGSVSMTRAVVWSYLVSLGESALWLLLPCLPPFAPSIVHQPRFAQP